MAGCEELDSHLGRRDRRDGPYLYLFYDWRLYADAGLQLVFIAFSATGMWTWWRGGERGEPTQARRASRQTLALVLLAVAVGTVVLRAYLVAVDGAAPLPDALLTAGSLGALYLLIGRYVETWPVWAVLDIGYVALFFGRELYLSAVLYAVLLVMVIRAMRQWGASLPRVGRGARRVSLGMVIGKFLPPHRGHLSLLMAARAQCDDVVAIVCDAAWHDVDAALRAALDPRGRSGNADVRARPGRARARRRRQLRLGIARRSLRSARDRTSCSRPRATARGTRR